MARKLVEWGFVVAGLVCLALFTVSLLRYRSFEDTVTRQSVHAAGPLTAVSKSIPNVIGRVTVPRIGLSVAMVEGDDEDSLAIAAGHMPGTAMVGRRGNVVIAGHRDSAFWPLRHIRAGDLVTVRGSTKSTYRVVTTSIVDPSDTAALADTQAAVLTLVTCYPFRFVGSAPKRFIVRANLVQ